MRSLRPFFFSCCFCLTSSLAIADRRLPGFFTDHMVLQPQKPLQVWGWASPGESVEVTLAGQNHKTDADSSGRWKTQLPALKASSEALTLSVRGNNKIELNDV